MTDINVRKIAIAQKVPNSDGNSIFGFAQLFPEDQDSFTRFLLVFVRSNRLSFLKAKKYILHCTSKGLTLKNLSMILFLFSQ